MKRLIHFGPSLPALGQTPYAPGTPDWVQANPARIERALARALARPSGGWYVVGASREIGETPTKHRILGRNLVAWRGVANQPMVAPAACPHMGANLADGRVCDGKIVCPWHGLALGEARHGTWAPFPAFDDGVLTWAQLSADEVLTPKPFITERPTRFLDAVIRVDAVCEPSDVIRNRLDPWHGAHYHPHSFAQLRVISESDDDIVVRVSYRVAGPFCSEVDARFHCPDPRTIAMTILEGEGKGSVVETHATPIDETHTAVIEATLATSDRPGFGLAVSASNLLRPLIQKRARRLWIEDAAYAERMYEIRQEKVAKKTRISLGGAKRAGSSHKG
ncbi:MAG: Rieske 2Fe-2S domain-containing protein [Sandaracinaceae bacterium]|nr:Rieske 2Fe-2S domain-containing protein [Sandaracinaceae bacterium]